ncbi:MAG: transposase [Gammaproteobacteria bacterium]|jgi:hypothetical protein|nr:transposase [Gammaproteobacteria bacterium]
MTHSYRSHYFHLIWSVKNRNNWIVQEIQPRLYAYIGGIIKNDKNILLSIGGMAKRYTRGYYPRQLPLQEILF